VGGSDGVQGHPDQRAHRRAKAGNGTGARVGLVSAGLGRLGVPPRWIGGHRVGVGPPAPGQSGVGIRDDHPIAAGASAPVHGLRADYGGGNREGADLVGAGRSDHPRPARSVGPDFRGAVRAERAFGAPLGKAAGNRVRIEEGNLPDGSSSWLVRGDGIQYGVARGKDVETGSPGNA